MIQIWTLARSTGQCRSGACISHGLGLWFVAVVVVLAAAVGGCGGCGGWLAAAGPLAATLGRAVGLEIVAVELAPGLVWLLVASVGFADAAGGSR